MKNPTFIKMFNSPLFFIEKMWGLVPQTGKVFARGKHITPQQHEILLAVEKALKKKAQNRISVASGHGIGKTACLAWLLLWFLFTRKESQIAATAPSSEQMYDILWKECAKWIKRMPPEAQAQYDWTTSHIRILDSPETWFARAKTARKENPESLAGMHGQYVMLLVDEASGVPEEIYNTAEGSLTDENTLTVLISNPTRLVGYFYDTHHRDAKAWQKFQFSGLDSPIVDEEYVNRIISKHGEESDEYRIRVLGEFPKADSLDAKGYVQLFGDGEIDWTYDEELMGETYMGIDPAGEGKDFTVWVVRDNFRGRVAYTEQVSTPKGIAEKTMTLMERFGTRAENITVDNFGVGANVSQELAFTGRFVNAVNVGMKPEEDEKSFLNLRALAYWRLRQWIKRGGELVKHKGFDELLNIRFRKELSGKMKIMSKLEMKREGIKSPDHADALMLTFAQQEKEFFGDVKTEY